MRILYFTSVRIGRKIGFWLAAALVSLSVGAQTGVICGSVCDGKTQEPLIGASVVLAGTTVGAITDIDGQFRIERVEPGHYDVTASYVSYQPDTKKQVAVVAHQETVLRFELGTADLQLEGVTVVARKNEESEHILLMERQKATVSVENIGAKEMSVKGISNVADGVKKLTGISMVGSGQLFVRGLGDRYSLTTVNGLVVASPNPDHKLIPLDLFPASAVKNITVNKVFQASSYADYAGAHIDIATKEQTGADFLTLSLSTGGDVNALFQDFYSSDKSSGRRVKNLPQSVKNMTSKEFANYVKHNDPFGTSFSIDKKKAHPRLNIGLGWGHTWELGKGELSVLLSGGMRNDYAIQEGSTATTLTAQGTKLNEFASDSYTYQTQASALGHVGYQFASGDQISYSLFFTQQTDDVWRDRVGFDSEGNNLEGSNSVYHLYRLMNHQLLGKHSWNDRFTLEWKGAYGITSSDEPDRRQVMFRRDEKGGYSLFKLNQQETMRFFGELDEKVGTGDLRLTYHFNDQNLIRMGGAYMDKRRDYYSTRFYYNLNRLNPVIDNIYNTDAYLNHENVANGTLVISKNTQPKYSYDAANSIAAFFVESDFYPLGERLLVNVGLRYEHARQRVDYGKDSGEIERSVLTSDDFLPALNLKYMLNEEQALRFACSRTVTRPQFIEMAPFLYQESYGSASVRGNADLKNGYDYNLDLRYEWFKGKDLYSATAYFKYLDSPIERIQELAGGSAVHSFMNADKGIAAGIELELRKAITTDWKVGMNAAWMYTHVSLPEEGVYTDKSRALQGASPFLGNADVTWSPTWKGGQPLNVTLLYNLQGSRIYTVGINQLGNIKENTRHTLDLNAQYQVNNHWSMKVQAKNLLGSTVRFHQEVASTGEEQEVENYQTQVALELGVSYKF